MFVCCLTAMSAKGTVGTVDITRHVDSSRHVVFAWEHIWIVLYKNVVMLHKNVEHKR